MDLDLDVMLNLYENTKDDLKFFSSSDVRVKIILCLENGSKNLSDLRKNIHMSSSTILHAMNQLESHKIIFRNSGKYCLSQIGRIAAAKLIDMIKSINSLKRCRNLFLNHDIDCIPSHLLKDIGCLNQSSVVTSSATDVMKPHTVLFEHLANNSNLKHLSSVFYPQKTDMLLQILQRGGNLHLILTENIMQKVLEVTERDILLEMKESGQLQLNQMEDDSHHISFTLGDDFLALGLSSTEGSYDLNVFLISEGEEAILWGNRLFNYYLNNAKEYEI